MYISAGYVPRSEIVKGLHGNNFPNSFLHSHQQRMRVPVVLSSQQHLVCHRSF